MAAIKSCRPLIIVKQHVLDFPTLVAYNPFAQYNYYFHNKGD